MRPTKNVPIGKLPEQKIRITVEDVIPIAKGEGTISEEYERDISSIISSLVKEKDPANTKTKIARAAEACSRRRRNEDRTTSKWQYSCQ